MTVRHAVEDFIPNISSIDEFPPLRHKVLANNKPEYAKYSSQHSAFEHFVMRFDQYSQDRNYLLRIVHNYEVKWSFRAILTGPHTIIPVIEFVILA